jgi:arylsulfatase A-like enzyme
LPLAIGVAVVLVAAVGDGYNGGGRFLPYRTSLSDEAPGMTTGKQLALAAAVLIVVTVSLTQTATFAKEVPRRPNFIFILTDDQGWSEMSAAMDPKVPKAASDYLETPNLERMAKAGMRFQSGYSPAPLCTPTRRSIQCGMTPARQRGTEFKSTFDWTGRLTIPRALKSVDPAYRCAHFGKYGENIPVTPEEIGYDESDGLTGNKTGGCPGPMEERGAILVTDDPKLTDSMTGRAVGFIQRQVRDEHPFYVQLSYYAVHLQVQARQAMLDKYKKKGTPDRAITCGFAGMLEELDAGVGQVLDTIERLKIADSTYVIFTSDNGGRGTIPGADESLAPPNRPLFGAKHSLYEGGIRVPFIALGPGVEPSSVCRVPVTGYDLLPTLYDLAGGQEALPDDIDGGSFRVLLQNGGIGQVKRSLDALVFHRPLHRRDPQSAIRVGDWKLMILWKVRNRERQRLLFNLAEDVGEQNDLSKQMPEKADQLERVLIDYLERVGAEKPKGQEFR